MPEPGLQRIRPAVVLLVATVEPLPAGGGQLAALAPGIDDLDLVELVSQQELLEL